MSCRVVVRSACVSRLTEMSFTATSRFMPVLSRVLHNGLGDWNRENTADFIDAALTRVSGAVDPDLKSLEIRIGIVDREATHLAIGAG